MFQDAIEGRSLGLKILSASGKLSWMGGRTFTFERFLYLGPGGRSSGAFSSPFPSAGDPAPAAYSGRPCVQRKKRKKDMESAAIRLVKPQRRFGIMAVDNDIT